MVPPLPRPQSLKGNPHDYKRHRHLVRSLAQAGGDRMSASTITTSMPGNGGTRIAFSAARSFLAPIRRAEKAGRDHAE